MTASTDMDIAHVRHSNTIYIYTHLKTMKISLIELNNFLQLYQQSDESLYKAMIKKIVRFSSLLTSQPNIWTKIQSRK